MRNPITLSDKYHSKRCLADRVRRTNTRNNVFGRAKQVYSQQDKRIHQIKEARLL